MTTLLKNAKIYDGTGKEAYAGDVLIADEHISRVGDAISYSRLSPESAMVG